MKGAVVYFDMHSGSGVLDGHDGVRLRFAASGVFSAGQKVQYKFLGGMPPQAVEVEAEIEPAATAISEQRRQELCRLRFLGFESRGPQRLYRFERIVPGQSNANLTVLADLALFARYRIGIQEGPELCLKKLNGWSGCAPVEIELTEADLKIFVEERLAAQARRAENRGGIRKPRPPRTDSPWNNPQVAPRR